MSSRPPGRRGGARTPPLDDWHLWSEVKKSVDPLRSRLDHAPLDREGLEKALNPSPDPASSVPDRARKPRVVKPDGPAAPAYRAVYEVSRAVAPAASPLEPNLKRRLVKGRLPIDGTLDLHGMTQEAAHESLLRFVFARASRGDRTILVITGKGLKKTGYLQIAERGILRHAVPRWLAQAPLSDFVAGVEAAHVAHGGEGALYVRLRAEPRRKR